jgi:regulatory protein
MIDETRRPGRDSDVSERGLDGSGGATVPTAAGAVTGDDTLAPVIPLFGPRVHREAPSSGASLDEKVPRSAADAGSSWARPGAAFDDVAAAESPDDVRDRAEALLLRKLRGRSLSLAEARTALNSVEGIEASVVDEVVEKFVDLGYLDDEAFAEQLALSATERRGQGRRAVAQTLRKRGIPREVVDAALAELPDDDAERALEFARSKARGVGGKDYDASLRRLAGQLARRGYPSSVSLDAARQALSEAGVRRTPPSRPTAPSTVRFTPDD